MKRSLMIGLLLLVMAACATVPKLSSQQRRQLQMHTFENAAYDTVFRAFKTVLQDEGYIITNQDIEGGLIVATIQKTDSSGSFWASLSGNQNYRTGEGYEISINLEKIRSQTVESRIIIQKLEQYSLGGKQGHEVLDAGLYKNFYNKVTVEVERRKAHGRN